MLYAWLQPADIQLQGLATSVDRMFGPEVLDETNRGIGERFTRPVVVAGGG